MKLKIGCTTFPVRYSTAAIFDEDDGTQQLNGYICYTEPHINIWKEAHDPTEVLLHEVLHGIVWDRALWGQMDEEVFITSFSRGLMQVIRDNPAFLKALQ
jgi:hypothetical protein